MNSTKFLSGTTFKSLVIGTGLVAVTAIAVLSNAQTTPTPPQGHGPGMMQGHGMPMMMNPGARAQKHLDKLEKKLNLKPEQQAAWSTYKSAVLAQANEHAAKMKAHHEQMKSGAAKPAEMNAPQRMEERAKHMREMADGMSRMAQQTQALYQVLTPEQRTIVDLMHQHRGMGKRMMMMRGGMDHDMQGGMHDKH